SDLLSSRRRPVPRRPARRALADGRGIEGARRTSLPRSPRPQHSRDGDLCRRLRAECGGHRNDSLQHGHRRQGSVRVRRRGSSPGIVQGDERRPGAATCLRRPSAEGTEWESPARQCRENTVTKEQVPPGTAPYPNTSCASLTLNYFIKCLPTSPPRPSCTKWVIMPGRRLRRQYASRPNKLPYTAMSSMNFQP